MRLQPPSVILAGPAGSGKTSSLATLIKAGLELFVVTTEPSGAESLIDACERIKAPIDRLHWAECLPTSEGWADLLDMTSKVSSMDQKGLSDIKDMGKASFRPAADRFIRTFANFHCDRTGKDFGDVTKFGCDRALALDSLTGLTQIAWGCTVGYKPTANPGEWGIGQNFIYNILKKINSDRQCFFAVTAHIEKEVDEMSGVRRIMVSTLGAKLAPKIPPLFSEVVLTSKRIDGKFYWSTLDPGMDLKNRALPNAPSLDPDFKPVVEAYSRRIAASASHPPVPPITAAPSAVMSQPKLPIAPMGPNSVQR